MTTHYIVQTANACMPQSCWGRYRRVAVLEVEAELDSVSMISEHALGCVQVVETWERLNVGSTAACAYEVALAEAQELCDELNDSTIARHVHDRDFDSDSCAMDALTLADCIS